MRTGDGANRSDTDVGRSGVLVGPLTVYRGAKVSFNPKLMIICAMADRARTLEARRRYPLSGRR
jgi:hypothetical protein